jgi:small subunit ribosomal protein S17
MDKTVVVEVLETLRHSRYRKVMKRRRKYYAHDASDAIEVGTEVRIEETRPLSKLKRWRVVEGL